MRDGERKEGCLPILFALLWSSKVTAALAAGLSNLPLNYINK